ncbi:helix-turn-helix domain-containing protein [Dyella sp. ASV21]|uniref:helix-turn-helix domain-containing protein n=1 Tax=Dyella sp. ASV21 TaxID=2795114 RepID=UPI0018EA775D|nr:helix-turn-helix domain-containing protein [Dyella sp. ASV21]
MRSVLVRSTLGYSLDDTQRINRFPATPLCTLSWWFEGSSELLVPERPGVMPWPDGKRTPAPGRWVLSGPQMSPTSTWSPGPVHGMMALFLPDALHLLTGLEPAAITDRLVDAASVLPPDWLAMCEAVQQSSDDAQRVTLLENFLEPRWRACRPALPFAAHRQADWAAYLAQRAAASTMGSSLRQLERRIKQWAGLPLRELRGFGRAEHAFFEALQAGAMQASVNLAEVAAEAGYADQSHLSRVMRRMTGYSPQALYAGMRREEAFWLYRMWGVS